MDYIRSLFIFAELLYNAATFEEVQMFIRDALLSIRLKWQQEKLRVISWIVKVVILWILPSSTPGLLLFYAVGNLLKLNQWVLLVWCLVGGGICVYYMSRIYIAYKFAHQH